MALFFFPVRVCVDHAFVDEATGSRKGHREWFLGATSGRWYKESVVETFMRTNQPAMLQQRWTSYAGTGRDILGRRVSFGHGRPGEILFLKPETINEYCERAADSEKRRLYDVLSAGDQKAIRELSAQIYEALLSQTSEPDGPANGSQPLSGDEKLRRTITGTWTRENNGVLTLASDGSFSSGWTNFDSKVAWTYEGQWEITNRVCVMTVTKSHAWNTTNSAEAVGSVDRVRIVRADGHELVWIWGPNGQTISFTRRR